MMNLPDGKPEQNSRAVVTIFIENVGNAACWPTLLQLSEMLFHATLKG